MSVRILGKLLFLRHPRTGSTATTAALIKVGAKKAGAIHGFVKAKRGELIVSTIRNPFDLLASWYALNPGWHHRTFEDFLFHYQHSAMVREGMLHYFAEHSDVLLLYDDLQAELNRLLERLKLPPVRIYRLNTTADKKPFESYYTDAIKNMVESIYAKDLELYRGLISQRT